MTDILNLIDNATEHRCACGCNTPLHPDGPSAWFASQECQRRWNETHATDPADVYNRPDGGDGWSRDAMVVGDGPSFAPTRFFLGDQEITDFVVPGSLSFEAFSRTVVTAESMEGRSGLISATSPAAWSVTGAMADWLSANLGDSIRLRYDTTPLADVSPTVTYSYTTPDGVLSYTESPGFTVYDETAGWMALPTTARPSLWPALGAVAPAPWPDYVMDRIEGLPDASMTITGYFEPAAAMLLFGNAYLRVPDRWRTREDIRRMHMSYSSRLRSRRRRNRR